MSVLRGPDGDILRGPDGSNILRGPDGDILRGPDGDILRGPPSVGAPLTAVLNGLNAYVEHDALKTACYDRGSHFWWIVLTKSADTDLSPFNLGSNTGIEPRIELDRGFSVGWRSRFRFLTSGANGFTVAGVDPADDVWRLWQYCGERRAGDVERPFVHVNGSFVQGADWNRFVDEDASFPAYVTFGALRHSAGPTIVDFAAQKSAYAAIVEDHVATQANMDAVWDAFDTGGGRDGLSVVSDAINSNKGAGVLQWAGPFDGHGSPHYDAGPFGNPTYVNVTFEDPAF